MSRAALVAAAALAVAASSLLAGCTGSDADDEAGTTTSAAAPTMSSVAVYFLRDGKVAPVRRTIAATPAVARAAVSSLFEGPTAEEEADGLTTAIPSGTTLGGIDVADGVATVDLRGPLPTSPEQRLRVLAQLVATLTRFSTVHGVRLGDGRVWNRHAIEGQTPQILVESPLPGDTVRSPIRVRGTANVFEATVSLEVRDEGENVVQRGFTTATAGTGTRGTFDAELAVPDVEGPVTIVAFEASAEDGRPLHVVEVPIAVNH